MACLGDDRSLMLAVEKTLLESTKRFPLFHRYNEDFRIELYQGLVRREGDETTVQRRAGIPGHSNAPLETVRLKGTAPRITIECPEISTRRPDTFMQTVASLNFKPLAVRRPYI